MKIKLKTFTLCSAVSLFFGATVVSADTVVRRTYTVSGDSGYSCNQTPGDACIAADAEQDAKCATYAALPDHTRCKITRRGEPVEDSKIVPQFEYPFWCRAFSCKKPNGACTCLVWIRDDETGINPVQPPESLDDLLDLIDSLELD